MNFPKWVSWVGSWGEGVRGGGRGRGGRRVEGGWEEICWVTSGEHRGFSWELSWSFEIGGVGVLSGGVTTRDDSSGVRGCTPDIYWDDSFWDWIFEEMFRESFCLVMDSLCLVRDSLSVDMSGTTTFFLALAISDLMMGRFPKKIGEVTFSIIVWQPK